MTIKKQYKNFKDMTTEDRALLQKLIVGFELAYPDWDELGEPQVQEDLGALIDKILETEVV